MFLLVIKDELNFDLILPQNSSNREVLVDIGYNRNAKGCVCA